MMDAKQEDLKMDNPNAPAESGESVVDLLCAAFESVTWNKQEVPVQTSALV